jgi:hypothetical protein
VLPTVQAIATGRPWRVRLSLFGLILLVLVVQVDQPRTPSAQLMSVTARHSFSIVGWQVRALAGSLVLIAFPPRVPADEGERIARVEAYYALIGDVNAARRDRDDQFNLPAERRNDDLLRQREARVRELEAQAVAERPVVEAILAAQLTEVLREFGLFRGLVEVGVNDGWPLPWIRISPPMFFRYETLPMNLVVAPRDRVAIVGSVLLNSELQRHEIELLEDRVDAYELSSVVTGIGGFATFPSMIPDSDGLRRGLNVMVHEWTHHYFFFHPLGQAYFRDYAMRSINEIVADMIGDEVGEHAFQKYYSDPVPASAPPATVMRPPPPPGPDFGVEMRRIRLHVDALLAAGQVDEAELYMQEQREYLNDIGFRVRKINTAYLAFFGAYTGAANPYEEPLRILRARSTSLADFVRIVQTIDSPQTLLQLADG